MNTRLQNEINHGKLLSTISTEKVWGWDTPAGKLRAQERFEYICTQAQLRAGRKVLELGAGTGFWSRQFGRTGVELTAIDISPDLLKKAKQHAREEELTIDFQVEDAMNTSFKDNTFDAVIGVSVLHHLEPEKVFREIRRILKPGGRLVFSEPNYLNPQVALERCHPKVRQLTNTSPDETAFFRWILKKQFKRMGLIKIQITPFDFLHPATPSRIISPVLFLSKALANLPIIREIAGSLKIYAQKP